MECAYFSLPCSSPFADAFELGPLCTRRTWHSIISFLCIVKPEIVIACHRQGFRLYWKWKSRVRHGRPSVPTEVQNLIQTMSSANPRLGAPRLHGELLKLGIRLAQATVAKYMVRHRKPPSQTWRTFLENHAKELVSTDFFVVPTATFRLLFVFLVLSHDRRRLLHFGVTSHPTAAWTARQLVQAFPCGGRHFGEAQVHEIADRHRIALVILVGAKIPHTLGRDQ